MSCGNARLVLRPLRLSDADDIHAGLQDWEVTRRMAMPPWHLSAHRCGGVPCKGTECGSGRGGHPTGRAGWVGVIGRR